MGQLSSKPFDVEEAWKHEQSLSLEERRQRYKCGSKFVALDKIPHWESVVEETLEKGTFFLQ